MKSEEQRLDENAHKVAPLPSPKELPNAIAKLCGVPIFEDSILRVYCRIPCHFDEVTTDTDAAFILADADEPAQTNCDLTFVVVTRNGTDEFAGRYRFYPAGSTDCSDGKDFIRRFRSSAPADHWPQERCIEEFATLVDTLQVTKSPMLLLFHEFQQNHTWNDVITEIHKWDHAHLQHVRRADNLSPFIQVL